MTLAVPLAVVGVSALIALHHLRSQPLRRPVATLLFWQQAAGAVQARALGGRFRHWRTFALLTCIIVLTAVAMAVGDRSGQGVAEDVLVIDAGASTAATDAAGRSRLDVATETARADLGRCRTPALILAGPTPTLLSSGDEPAAVLSRHLGEQRPQAGASSAGPAIELAASVQGPGPGRILWYTTQNAIPDGLPPAIRDRVQRRPVPAAPAVAIVAAQFARSGSDAGLRVTVAGETASPVVVELLTRDAPAAERTVGSVRVRSEVVFDAVPAAGQTVTLRLHAGPRAEVSQAFQMRLPDERPVAIRFDADIPQVLKAALLSFGVRSADGAIAVVKVNTPRPREARAAIVIVEDGPAGQTPPEVLTANVAIASGLGLEGASAAVAASPVLPGSAVLSAGGVPVISLDETPAGRTAYVRQSLLSPDAELPRRAAFPLLLQRLCDRLVDRVPATSVVSASRQALDPLWRDSRQGAADQAPAIAADPPVVSGPAGSKVPVPSTPPPESVMPWAAILLSLAFVLLVLEGLLHAARRIV